MEEINPTQQRVQQYPAPLTPWQYALYIFLAGIPLVGLILLLVWAFSSGENIHRKNWSKGMLLIMVLSYVLIILFFTVFAGVGILGAVLSDDY